MAMASVFLSYDRDDSEKARRLALALEKAGHEVWWDLHVRGGAQFSKVIEEALKAADAVVVLWSQHSIESPWVRDEAAAGRDSGRLVPATLDGTEPPLGFRQYQTIDLSRWSGRGPSAAPTGLLDAVAALDRSAPTLREPEDVADPTKNRLTWPLMLAVAFTALFAVAAATFFWRPWADRSEVPVIAVVSVEQTAGGQALARNLLVKLGSLHSAKTEAVRLTGARGKNADFIFETSGRGPGDLSRANLALIAGKDRTVLWSKDFSRQVEGEPDPQQQMAYAAGQVLACALQASKPGAGAIDQDSLRAFLNGCALFGEKYRVDPRSVIPIFASVVAKAPRFEPAWRKLLLAEAQFTRVERQFFGRFTPGKLREHINRVRELNPEIPEISIAEAEFLPINAFVRRAELVERAIGLDPANPDLLVVQSELLFWVGRVGESVDAARRAADLDPLSPGLRSAMIAALAYSGHVDTAYQELRRAEELWPGTTSVKDARLRLNTRFGDAAEALKMLRSEATRGPAVPTALEAYLVARIEPTEANIARAITQARSRASTDLRDFGNLAQAMGQFGREDELYELLLKWPSTDMLGTISEVFFRPMMREFREDSRFMAVATRAGLVDYWRKTDRWPDFCSEPDLPYDCREEAAKAAL
jgi:Flp pilus assembly protein TadD